MLELSYYVILSTSGQSYCYDVILDTEAALHVSLINIVLVLVIVVIGNSRLCVIYSASYIY